jgi:hypothetical protein
MRNKSMKVISKIVLVALTLFTFCSSFGQDTSNIKTRLQCVNKKNKIVEIQQNKRIICKLQNGFAMIGKYKYLTTDSIYIDSFKIAKEKIKWIKRHHSYMYIAGGFIVLTGFFVAHLATDIITDSKPKTLDTIVSFSIPVAYTIGSALLVYNLVPKLRPVLK